MRILSMFCVVSTVLALMGCGPSELMTYSSEQTSDRLTFREYLIDEYLKLAEYEQNIERDYSAAENYIDKVARIERGAIARIDNLENFELPSLQVSELTQAQDELVNALKKFRLAENRKNLAIAHSRYDCWVDQAEEKNAKGRCKKEFKRAMSNLIHPIGNEEEFIESEEDFFGWHSRK